MAVGEQKGNIENIKNMVVKIWNSDMDMGVMSCFKEKGRG